MDNTEATREYLRRLDMAVQRRAEAQQAEESASLEIGR